MSKSSSIEWTDATWNVAVGCTKVDADCKFCYMYRDSMKGTRYNPKVVRQTKGVFRLPLTLKTPSRIFVSSLTDFFHPDIDSYRQEAWNIIRACPQHTFQILTKRPERILSKGILPPDWGEGWDHVWLGTSVGSSNGIWRLGSLACVPSKTRFISFEPLHEFITLKGLEPLLTHKYHWAIIGGESGNETGQYRYRPCKLDWIKYLMITLDDECKIPVFIKQLGTHIAMQFGLKDRHGRDMSEWNDSWLKVREFPKSRKEASSV